MTDHQALNARQQSIVAIAAFEADGDMAKLSAALDAGLDAGLTVNEIKEILVQLYAYTGFPRSLNALTAFMKVLKAREARGVKDRVGQEASPLPANKSSVELGTENQTRLSGRPVTGGVYAFAPAIDQFLKGHLFGDIFGRDNLDFQSRELATVAALASMQGVSAQLRAHFRIAMNTGLTPEQLHSLVAVLGDRVGAAEADNANAILNTVTPPEEVGS